MTPNTDPPASQWQAMRFIYVFVLMLLATVQSAFAQNWLSHYYQHPTPERFVTEVKALSKAGNFSNPKSAALVSVFLGKVMAANPTMVGGWLNQLADLKGGDRHTLLMAANLSGTKEAQAYIARQADAERYRIKPVDIKTLEQNDPTVLDMLWAEFFATGEAMPVRRVVAALNYDKYDGALKRYAKSDKTEKDRNDALLEAVFKAAMWSLESNARQHPRVAEILEQFCFAAGLTASEQLWLSGILAKAMPDKFEISREQDGQWAFKRKAPAQDSTGWRDANGKPMPDTDAMKSKDGFGGSVLVTSDADWQAKWDTPPETKPSFTMADDVPYGKKVFILTFFVNPMLDQHGKANVRCDIKLLTPTGKVALDQKDAVCFAGALKGSPYAMRLSAPVIAFSGDPGDPQGTWGIEVTLRDAVRKVELPLRTSFELQQP